MHTPCPSTTELQHLLSDLPGDSVAERAAQHLEQCAECQAKLEQLATAGTNLSELVQGLSAAEPAAHSAYWAAVGALPSAAPLAATIAGSPAPRSATNNNFHNSNIQFLAPPTDPAYLGRLAHFDVMRVLGRGGMGIVLEAFDTRLQRNVAVKVLNPDFASDETARQRFCREARAAASISHENVVAVHQVEHAAEDGLPYLVMQLITGETLEQRLLREGRLPIKEIVRIGMQTAQGLAAAHAQGLIHRDIKPGNILLEPPSGRVKLTDFGLARIADDVKLTRTGFVSGTPLYMSPEQARGEPGDARSDLFSLGAILYEMCAGQPPFQGNSALAIMKQISDNQHRPIRGLNPEVPSWLAEMIDELLAKKPADRYQSAADLAEVFDYAWARLRSSDDLPAVCQEEQQQRSRRNLFIFSLVGCALLAAGTFLGMFLPSILRSPTAPDSSTAPLAVLAANAGSVWSLSFHPQNDVVAMAVEDGSVRLWDCRQQAILETFDAHRGVVWASQFFNEGELLATAGDDGLLKIWSRSKQDPVKVFEHPNAVRGLAIDHSGRLYAGDRQGGLHVWSLESQEPLAKAQQPGAVYSVALSPDGATLATAGSDKTIRLWNATSLTQRLPLAGHAGPVYGLSFSPSGDLLASAGWDGTIRIWDPASGNLRNSWAGGGGDIWSIAFSPRGVQVATGNTDGSVRLWNAASGELLATYRGHNTTVHTVSFNHDGTLLGSGGRDGAVRIWRVD